MRNYKKPNKTNTDLGQLEKVIEEIERFCEMHEMHYVTGLSIQTPPSEKQIQRKRDNKENPIAERALTVFYLAIEDSNRKRDIEKAALSIAEKHGVMQGYGGLVGCFKKEISLSVWASPRSIEELYRLSLIAKTQSSEITELRLEKWPWYNWQSDLLAQMQYEASLAGRIARGSGG